MDASEQILFALAALLTAVAAYVAPGPYNRVYLDDPTVCNMTIRLHDAMPAVLVRLSDSQLMRPIVCSLQVEIDAAGIAGLIAVVQNLDIGKFDDRTNCTNYLQVTTYDRSSRYRQRLCDEWSSKVHHQEPGRSLFAGCHNRGGSDRYDYCAIRRVNLLAHVPSPVLHVTGQPLALSPSFTVIVTAYYNEQIFGGCGSGRFMCSDGRVERCIDERLVCDGRPNCGFVNSKDEFSSTCRGRAPASLSESDHFFATWAGFAVIVLLLVVAVSYFIRSVRWTTAGSTSASSAFRQEVSSTGSAGGGGGRRTPPRPPPAPPRPDAPQPPPYEALFPHGPPAGALEKKRLRAGESAPAPAPAATPLSSADGRRRAAAAPPPPPVEEPGSLTTAPAAPGQAAVTRICVEPGAAPEEPPPYSERPALRHSVLIAEAVIPPR